MTDGVARDDLTECWCCGSLTERPSLCPACDDAECNRFTDDCQADHVPVTDGGERSLNPETEQGDRR